MVNAMDSEAEEKKPPALNQKDKEDILTRLRSLKVELQGLKKEKEKHIKQEKMHHHLRLMPSFVSFLARPIWLLPLMALSIPHQLMSQELLYLL